MDSSQHTETSPISLIEAGERREGGGPRHTQLHTGNRTTIPITVVGQDTPLLEDGGDPGRCEQCCRGYCSLDVPCSDMS